MEGCRDEAEVLLAGFAFGCRGAGPGIRVSGSRCGWRVDTSFAITGAWAAAAGVVTAVRPATLPPSSASLADASRRSSRLASPARSFDSPVDFVQGVMAWLLASAVAGAATLSSDSDAGLLCFPPS